jgi:two-component system invasion response regulator UvrY
VYTPARALALAHSGERGGGLCQASAVAPTRAMVVDDDDFTRTLVASLVESLGYEVVARSGAVTEAMGLAHGVMPDFAVLDLDLGEGPTGVDLAHGLRKIHPRIAIVMLTSYGDPTWMGLSRQVPVGTRYVVKGQVNDAQVLADAIVASLVDPLAADSAERTAPPLSEGQWEILRLVAAGYTNAEIARRRSLSEDAVNKAVTRLVKQLDLDVGSSGNARVLLTQAFNRITGSVSERRG